MKCTPQISVFRTIGSALVLISLQAPANAEEATELSQYGITWKFDRPCVVGKFVTGDYWVVGPMKIIGTRPEAGPGMNASDPYAAQRDRFKRPGDEGRTFDPFVDAMWAAYRPTVPEQAGATRRLKWIWKNSREGKFVPNSKDGN